MISGPYKVLHFYAQPEIAMLFDLSQDLGEVNNIAKQDPDSHRKLYGEMMEYLQQVGVRFPKANRNYDPKFYKQLKDYQQHALWGQLEGRRRLEGDEK